MLRKPTQIFTQDWVDSLSHIPEIGMVATIKIIQPNRQSSDYDFDTNSYSDTSQVIYNGKARVQPVRSSGKRKIMASDSSIQNYLFSIPVINNNIDLRVKHQVFVTEAELNPTLLNYVFTISEIGDSSNILERTFYCISDQQRENNGP